MFRSEEQWRREAEMVLTAARRARDAERLSNALIVSQVGGLVALIAGLCLAHALL